jgi:hypothetical protein
MTKYNTNLASEFYVLSMLYRLGADASLTLGNKKSVDIIVVLDNETIISIDVKGVAGRYDWPADNIHDFINPNKFYVLVSFEGNISDPLSQPNTWIIPADKLLNFKHDFKTRVDISRKLLMTEGQEFLHAWDLITR